MIINAVERGNYVYVYNEKNYRILALNGKLHGFTSSTVSVKQNNYVYTYNEKGARISAQRA